MKLPFGKIPSGKLSFGKLAKRDGAQADAAETPAAALRGKRRRIPVNKATLSIGSGATIFAIGFVMQNFSGHPAAAPTSLDAAPVKQQSMAALPTGLDIDEITPTASGALPELPQEQASAALPQDQVAPDVPVSSGVELARLEDPDTPMPLQIASSVNPDAMLGAATAKSTPVLPCEITLTADPAPAAMVDLMVEAACLAGERYTLHHNGMMFHAMVGDEGRGKLRVPALAENAVFIASFGNGEGAVAQIEVPTLAFYDRVVVQWRGDAGLGLHALEFDATYFGEGHVHGEAPGDLADAASGTSGFLSRFGHDTGAEALMAEVYTFPSQMSETEGRVALSVEAEVTEANCGTEIEAQTLQFTPGKSLRSNDLTLYVPECDGSGDFLVLNNLLQDMKVAAN